MKIHVVTKRTTVFNARAALHEAATHYVFRDAKSSNLCDGLLKARNPNALALPRIVERSHSLYNMILPLQRVSTLHSCSSPTLKSAFQFSRSCFYEAKLPNLEDAFCQKKEPEAKLLQPRIVETRTVEIS